MKLLKAIHNVKVFRVDAELVVAGCKDMKLLKAIHNTKSGGTKAKFVVAGCKDMKLLKAIHNKISCVRIVIVLLLGAKI